VIRDRVLRWFARRIALLVGLIGLASVLAELAPLHWFLELFSHFATHYAILALAAALVLGALRRWRWTALALGVACWNSVVVAQSLSPSARPTAHDAQRLTILHFNVGVGHRDPRRVMDYVLAHAERFDVVVLIEAGPQWKEELDRALSVYPHSVLELEDTPFGIAVMSRAKPIASAVVETPGGFRHVEVRLAIPGQKLPVALYAIHPPPPVSGDLADARNDYLARIASAISGRADETAIVVGDFNTTPYSPYLRRFVKETALLPSRCCLLHQGTWPVIFGNAWFGIPIDHSLVTARLRVAAHEIGPDLGSDHLPIVLSVAAR